MKDWPFGKSRENETPIDVDAVIRRFVPGLCAKCQYVSDLCEDIEKETKLIDGRTHVIKCEGFEGFDDET